MKRLNPLIAFAVLITFVGLYQNWSATFTQAWWFAVLGGVCIAILHFATRHATTAIGMLGLVLLVLGLFGASFWGIDRSMFSGLACGLMAGLCAGYTVRLLLIRKPQTESSVE